MDASGGRCRLRGRRAYANGLERLPTEAEWEFAARGGLEARICLGRRVHARRQVDGNTWQGEFPWRTCPGRLRVDPPVGSFPPNGYGLDDMAGNVWEWTADWYTSSMIEAACCTLGNPRGGVATRLRCGAARLRTPRKVIKGGSYFCAPNYCRRYRPAARRAQWIRGWATSGSAASCVSRTFHGDRGRPGGSEAR